jgi:hypothetical protein
MGRDIFPLEPNGSREEPQVYKLPGVAETAKPAAAPRSAAPRPVSLPPLPVPPSRPAPPAPKPAPTRPSATPPAAAPRELTLPKAAKIPRPNDVSGLNLWVSGILFTLMLLAGLTLAVYTLGQPFFVE